MFNQINQRIYQKHQKYQAQAKQHLNKEQIKVAHRAIRHLEVKNVLCDVDFEVYAPQRDHRRHPIDQSRCNKQAGERQFKIV